MKNIFLILIFYPSLLFPQSYKSYESKGDSLYHQFEISEAFNAYKKAYELEPEKFPALVNIVKIYNAAGESKRKEDKRDEAEKYFNKAVDISEKFIELYPDSSLPYTYLAISYGNLARQTGAKERLTYARKIEENAKKAIEKDSSNFMPYIILGAYYRAIASLSWIERTFANILYGDVPEGSLEDSEKMLKKALELNEKIINANFQMALTYRAMDNSEKEKEYFKKVLDLPIYDYRDPYFKERAKRVLAN